MWSWVGVLGIVFGVFFSVFWAGHSSGKKSSDATWQPVYHILADKLTKLQTDLNLSNAEASGLANSLGKELTTVGVEKELDYVKMQREVDRRVNSYLDNLARVRLDGEADGNTGSDPTTNSLPLSTSVLNLTSDPTRLARSMVGIERDLVKRLLQTRDNAITRNIICKDYLEAIEEEMKPLRAKHEAFSE